MTHDELLFKIYEIHNNSSDAGQEANKQYRGMIHFMQALRAVVKLHKPFMGNTLELCYECMQLRKVDDPVITYPCRTIRAIEEELR